MSEKKKKKSESKDLIAPEKELEIASIKPFTFKMGPEEDRREVSIRPIRLGDLSYIADSVFGLLREFSNSSGKMNLKEMGEGSFDKSLLILLAPAQEALQVVLAYLTDTDEDFILNLEMLDISILLRAFVEQNQVEMLIQNFTEIASRVREASQAM